MPGTDASPIYQLRAPLLDDPWGLGGQRMRQLRDDVEQALARPYAALAAAQAQSIPNGAYTKATFGTVVAWREMGVNAAAGTLTVTRAGAYLIAGAVCYAANATGVRYATLAVNAATLRLASVPGFTGGQPTPTVSAILNLTVGDVITLEAYQSSGAALNTGNPSHLTNLSATYLGA